MTRFRRLPWLYPAYLVLGVALRAGLVILEAAFVGRNDRG